MRHSSNGISSKEVVAADPRNWRSCLICEIEQGDGPSDVATAPAHAAQSIPYNIVIVSSRVTQPVPHLWTFIVELEVEPAHQISVTHKQHAMKFRDPGCCDGAVLIIAEQAR